MLDELKKWLDFFTENNIGEKQKLLFFNYIEGLLKNDVPIIFEFNHLAMLLGMDSHSLAKITLDSSKSYRLFSIPKRSGGEREIASPYPSLAHCQSWTYENILKKITMSEHCHAFCKGKNIIGNARIHIEGNEILKMDISNFFGSIKIERVISIFKNLGYTNLLSFHLASVCCLNNALPQGACTSPIISNIIAKRLDRRLFSLALSMNLKYSRYADDLTFSGDSIPYGLSRYVEKILFEEGFTVNHKKTILKKKNQKKIVTGLCISNKKVRVPKQYRRSFRQDMHYLMINKINEFSGDSRQFDPIYIDRMIGRANFILMVEPENLFVIDSIKKLHDMKDLFK